MNVNGILALQSVLCGAQASSKKHALDILSQLLAEAAGTLNAAEVFDSLVSRERLGCTAIGESVAVPHGRIGGIQGCIGAFLRLAKPVDFDARDGEPVDLVFGLLIPNECGEEDLGSLKELTQHLADPRCQAKLRQAEDAEELHQILIQLGREEPPQAAQA